MPASSPLTVGRYRVYGEIASGGMATVHYGRLLGPAGFSRTVAIKRLHAQFAKDADFATMFLDEARLAARIQHPNVVSTLDVVAEGGEIFLVLEYVAGESLGKLQRAAIRDGHRIEPEVASAILCATLHGLHAAHEARSERGEPLHIVHRDVSPQNILVGIDGIAKVLDFGVAKAVGRFHTTRDGRVKGKLAYMAPEQLRGGPIDRRTDVFAAGIVLWELLTGHRLFAAANEGETAMNALEREVEPPSRLAPGIPPELDHVVLKALARDPARRYPSARHMALALESAVGVASPRRVGEWVEAVAGDVLSARANAAAAIDRSGEGLDDLSGVHSRETPPASGTEVKPAVHTQVSSISVSSGARPSKPRRRWLGVLAFFGVLGAAAFFSWRSGYFKPRQLAAPDATDVALPPPPESATPTTTGAASPSASSMVSEVVSEAPLPRRPVSGTLKGTRNAPAPASTGGKNCRIRSYVDDSGYTKFVRECR